MGLDILLRNSHFFICLQRKEKKWVWIYTLGKALSEGSFKVYGWLQGNGIHSLVFRVIVWFAVDHNPGSNL